MLSVCCNFLDHRHDLFDPLREKASTQWKEVYIRRSSGGERVQIHSVLGSIVLPDDLRVWLWCRTAGRKRVACLHVMQRITNIFSALSFIEDDEDLTPVANPKAKGATSASKSSSHSTSVKDAGGNKRDSNGPLELYKPLFWIDLEMTGLDLETDLILEIACIITDGRLEKTIEGPDLIIHQSEDALARMNDWCQEHHTASGLVDGVRRSTISQEEAEKQVLDFVSQHLAPGRALLAGNSVYVDLLFLRKYMPKLAEFFPHVLMDVSSIRALCVRWYPRDADKAPQKKKTHRALEDIKESIAELKYMQEAIFKRPNR